MRTVKRISALMLCWCLLLPVCAALADTSFSMAHDGFSTSYTYTYDFWGDVQMSPDAYRVTTVIDAVSLGLDKLTRPQSLFVQGQDLYIADTGNNRIVQVHYDGRDTPSPA